MEDFTLPIAELMLPVLSARKNTSTGEVVDGSSLTVTVFVIVTLSPTLSDAEKEVGDIESAIAGPAVIRSIPNTTHIVINFFIIITSSI
jgi:hypothetical protein